MSDKWNKTRELSEKRQTSNKKFSNEKTCETEAGGSSDSTCNAIMARNQMSSSMQQFCLDSNLIVNTARKCSLAGNKYEKKRKENRRKFIVEVAN